MVEYFLNGEWLGILVYKITCYSLYMNHWKLQCWLTRQLGRQTIGKNANKELQEFEYKSKDGLFQMYSDLERLRPEDHTVIIMW